MTRIKICGLRFPEDIRWANRLKPDYVGFVFAPSRRRVTAGDALLLKKELDPSIPAVGVFVDEDLSAIQALLEQGIIDAVQLHGEEDAAYIAAVRAMKPRLLIKAVRVGESLPALPAGADYPLFDTLSGGARGGTGQTFDWSLLERVQQPYFLAGGLDQSNLERAISTLSPFCVDLSSGVETGGRKDPDKMAAVIRLVRQTAG